MVTSDRGNSSKTKGWLFTLGQTFNPSLAKKADIFKINGDDRSYWNLLKSQKVMKTDENINTMEINENIKKCLNYWNSWNCFNWKATKTNEFC